MKPLLSLELIRATAAAILGAWREHYGETPILSTSIDRAVLWHLAGWNAPSTARGQLDAQFDGIWAQSGFPTFQLTHGLASALLLTDCTGVRAEDIPWPFESFLIVLPHPGGPLSFFDVANKTRLSARWIYFHRSREAPADAANAILGRWKSTILRSAGELTACREATATLPCDLRTNIQLASAEGVGVNDTRIWPEDGESMEPWLDPPPHLREGEALNGAPLVNDADWQSLRAAGRLLVNLALYIAETRRTPATPRLSKAASGAVVPSGRPVLLGADVKLPASLREAARAYCERDVDAGVSWRVQSRHVVRGHWRNQACGKGRADRRRMLIQPHFRGPADGPVLARQYAVDTLTESQ